MKDDSKLTKLRNRITLMLILALTSVCTASAQGQKLQFRPYADLRPFHYGFFFGLHTQSLQLINNGYIDPSGQQWFVSNDRHDPGFTVGVLGEWRLTDRFSVRVLPTMNFGTKHLTFRNQSTGEQQYQEMRSTHISVPVNVKFAPPRINNYRPYFMAGVNPSYDLTIKDQDNIMVKPFNIFLEVGFGCDKYLPYFKFIPEFKFCLGLLDILQTNRSSLRDDSKLIFTKSVNKAKSNMFVLTFYFE